MNSKHPFYFLPSHSANLQKLEFKSLLSWCGTKEPKESLKGKILALAIWSRFLHRYSMPNSEKNKSLYPLIPYLIKTRPFYPNNQATLLNTHTDFSPLGVRSERFSFEELVRKESYLAVAAVTKLCLSHKMLFFPREEGWGSERSRQQPCSALNCATASPSTSHDHKKVLELQLGFQWGCELPLRVWTLVVWGSRSCSHPWGAQGPGPNPSPHLNPPWPHGWRYWAEDKQSFPWLTCREKS